jgi:hypothetical protein
LNVLGHNFRDLHLQLDEIVDVACTASDTIAERLRALHGRSDTIAAGTTVPAFPAGEKNTARVVDLVVNRPRAAVATLRRQRARLGVNFRQIPVNRPKSPVHSYSKDGAMRIDTVSDPVYAPNSVGGPKADPSRAAEAWLGYTGGQMVREAYTLHAEDDDYGQANTLVNKVMNDAERARLVSNVAGALTGVVSDEIRERAFQYWNNIDKPVGQRIEQAVRNGG